MTAGGERQRRQAPGVALVMACMMLATSPVVAQPAPAAGSDALRDQIGQHFDALPVQGGVALRPKTPAGDVRWIEVTDAGIAVNGAPVTGAELRGKLGDLAPLVLRLSYLDSAARSALFSAAAAPAPAPVERSDAEPAPDRRAGSSRGVFRLGRDIAVARDEIVVGDVIAVGGSIRVEGEVQGNAAAIGGSVELGPDAAVRDVVVVGGRLRRAPTSRVTGEQVEIGPRSLPAGAWGRPGLSHLWWSWWMGSAVALISTVIRVAIVSLLTALVVLLAREHVERISHRAAAEPLKSGAIGLLAQLLFVPILIVTIVTLVVTIVGIPFLLLIPFVLLGLWIVALVGFTAVAYRVGHLLGTRFGWHGQGPIAAALVGLLLLVSPVLLARLASLAGGVVYPMTFGLAALGFLVEYVAWTVGFGATALTWFNRRQEAASTR